jgi:phosphatidylserine/phosphatidylglycerophosphate/cardiolipin synthase-like enzyme
MNPDLLEAICRLASRLPSSALRQVALWMREHDTPSDLQRHAPLAGHSLDPDNRALLSTLLQTWASADGHPRGTEVAAALEAAAHQDQRLRAEVQLELVWTGPSSVGSGLRQTEQVLYDLIDSARTSILVVAFAAYRVATLVQALRRALDRQVRVTFVLEDREESGGKVTIGAAEALKTLDSPAVQVYTWPLPRRPRNERGEHGSLHAKFVVVDGERLFLTSANLTEFAMTLNAELGVLISGGDVPRQALGHVLTLIRDGTLSPVSGR